MASHTVKRRKAIPRRIADQLLYDADRTCCVCEDPHKRVQIHHLDGDSSNNELRNLAVLCLNHHDEATRGRGLGRDLSVGLIRHYQDAWLRKVSTRRGSVDSAATREGVSHEHMLDTLACHEMRKLMVRSMEADWQERMKVLQEFLPYVDYRYGYHARKSILEALSYLADHTRNGMPIPVAAKMHDVGRSRSGNRLG